MSNEVSATRDEERSFLPAARFRALTPYFDKLVRATTREPTFRSRLLERISVPPGASVLDLGAGTGTFAIQLRRRHPDARIVGIDPDPEILAIARRKAAGSDVEVEFREAFGDELPFDDGSFDLVVSTLVFHHLKPDVKRAALKEVRRVLKPDGRLYVGDFGNPADPLQTALLLQTRVFDGFDVTADSRRGRGGDVVATRPYCQRGPRPRGRARCRRRGCPTAFASGRRPSARAGRRPRTCAAGGP